MGLEVLRKVTVVAESIEYDGVDRRQDDYTRRRLDQIQKGYERFASRNTKIILALTLSTLFLGILSVRLSGEAKDLGVQIQKQRRQAIMDNCTSINTRHDSAIAVLFKTAGDIARRDPKQAKSARAVAKQNALIINAALPKVDCKALVAKQVQGVNK